MDRRAVGAAVLSASLLAAGATAVDARQGAPATATTADAIVRAPTFFHGRPVAIAATPVRAGGLWLVDVGGPIAIAIQPATGQPPLRPLELRGIIVDPHALAPADPRRASLRPITDVFTPGRTAGKTGLVVLTNATWLDDATPAMTLRAIALHPRAWDSKPVTIKGRFHGRNLYDELPAAPSPTAPTDFVVQAADAALWVRGLPPRGPGFAFDPAVRIDTSRWLTVTGVVHVEAGLVWIDATALEETAPAPESIPMPTAPTFRLPPPVVIFTAPVDHDDDVNPATTVRVQFSRDMRETTFAERVTVRYAGSDAKPPTFTLQYRVATRSIELTFSAPLLAGATVVVRLEAGVTALDNAPLQPSEITFRVRS